MATFSRTSAFSHLLSPRAIGAMTLTNRVVLPAMDMNVCEDGFVRDRDIGHYAVRAAGGAGLVITSACAVAFPIGATSMKEPGLSDDAFIPGLRRLTDAVHAAGAKLCVQATHHGTIAKIDTLEDRPLLVPSVPFDRRDMSALVDNTPQELAAMAATTDGKSASYHEATDDDLQWLIGQFAAAARRLAIIVRVAGQEFGEDGALTNEEAVTAAGLFEAAGADAIHVTGWARNPFRDVTDGPLPDRVAAFPDLARSVKEAVRIPVIAVGRLLPEVAEELVASGGADFVAMGRQLLADPELVVKLREGDRRSIRPCINRYVCVEQNFWDNVPVCAVNPALGDEQAAQFTPASRSRSKTRSRRSARAPSARW